jgi:thiamine-phosphate pyrophosphorylase
VICLVTDRHRLDDPTPSGLIGFVRDAAVAGVDLVQLRERDLPARELLRLAVAVLDVLRGTTARLVVNDRLDVALASRAHGVHLPAASLPPSRVRGVAPAGFLIGRSIHHLSEAADPDEAVDYLLFGTVFGSRSKPGIAAAGIPALQEAVARAPRPVLAIGGVTGETAAEVAAAGAAGLAAIDWFVALARLGPAPFHAEVARVRQLFDTRRSVHLQ